MEASISLTTKELNVLEHLLYLPFLLTILERDRENAQATPFKLGKVYENLLENTIIKIQRDLLFFKNIRDMEHLNLLKGRNDGEYTEYHFYKHNVHYVYGYSNKELKINTEKLLTYYLFKEGVY